jgi:hypothetical protein
MLPVDAGAGLPSNPSAATRVQPAGGHVPAHPVTLAVEDGFVPVTTHPERRLAVPTGAEQVMFAVPEVNPAEEAVAIAEPKATQWNDPLPKLVRIAVLLLAHVAVVFRPLPVTFPAAFN